MSSASPNPAAPSRTTLETVLAAGVLKTPHCAILRALVWISLLSVPELGRLVTRANGARFDAQTLRGYLGDLERHQLVEHVACHEPGGAARHHRYYISDLGLHALVAQYAGRLSAATLAACYPVTRTDLLARLARLPTHLVLSDFVTRLAATPGYQLTSYEQPWQQSFFWPRRRQIWRCDGALLLQDLQGATHACYLLVDHRERPLVSQEEKQRLARFFDLRRTLLLAGEGLPRLLILSFPERFAFWADLLADLALAQNAPPPPGALADATQMEAAASAPAWYPFHALVLHQDAAWRETVAVSLFSLLDQPVSTTLSETFSHRLAFEHLLSDAQLLTPTRRRRTLPRYVGPSLREETPRNESHAAVQADLAAALHGTKAEQVQASALLTLRLSASQKALLALLGRHPWLSLPDLLALLFPGVQDMRPLQRNLALLTKLGLISVYTWPEGASWHECERYALTDSGQRYLAVRHGYSRRHPPLSEGRGGNERGAFPTLGSLQRGAGDLREQMAHTSGLYACIRAIVTVGRQLGTYQVLSWKNAHEALCPFRDPLTRQTVLARPDAELLVATPEFPWGMRFLIEYDRGTTFRRDYETKFCAYADYETATGAMLPPILMLIQGLSTQRTIERTLHELGIETLPVIFVLAKNLPGHGLPKEALKRETKQAIPDSEDFLRTQPWSPNNEQDTRR